MKLKKLLPFSLLVALAIALPAIIVSLHGSSDTIQIKEFISKDEMIIPITAPDGYKHKMTFGQSFPVENDNCIPCKVYIFKGIEKENDWIMAFYEETDSGYKFFGRPIELTDTTNPCGTVFSEDQQPVFKATKNDGTGFVKVYARDRQVFCEFIAADKK